jgi:hypothetical protein
VASVAGALLVFSAGAQTACAHHHGCAPEIDPGYTINAIALLFAVTFLFVGMGARRSAQTISQ